MSYIGSFKGKIDHPKKFKKKKKCSEDFKFIRGLLCFTKSSVKRYYENMLRRRHDQLMGHQTI
jgi:hypothetical protein